ncbi:DoxX family protein [Streptomyces zaehneri]|uniref:DoxX family protein n=1 Tax=Streptomyces zaehneri TaxID=3051180 RepID=UPI0028D287F6|nr:DoxX family protein [Streptomyces sp. DSM 40713]
MFTTYIVVAVLMSAVLVVSAGAKAIRTQHITGQIATLGVPESMLLFLVAAQVSGAAGLLVGVWWGPLGIAAAAGLTLYFAGAVASHLRVGDYKGTPPAIVLTLIAIALIALRAATL